MLKVKGIQKVSRNIRKQAKDIKNKTMRGYWKAGMLVLREASIQAPHDIGNLRASAFIMSSVGEKGWKQKRFKRGPGESGREEDTARLITDHAEALRSAKQLLKKKGRDRMGVMIGFSAYYALYVHEDAQATHAEGTNYKFLQNALEKNQKKILKIIAEEAKKNV